MSVERNKDGSVTINSNNGASAVFGRIVFVSDDKQEDKFKVWVEQCAKAVIDCAHTFKETEHYFLEHCDALPLDLNDNRMKSYQINVIMNHCKDKLGYLPSEFSFDMTDNEIEKWHNENTAMREEIKNSSPERFGLNIHGYYLPNNERNAIFYEQACLKWTKHTDSSPKQIEKQDIYFCFEESTEHWESSGGGDNLMQQLIVFRGVSEDDIQKRTPRFLGYISTLRDMGNLPDFKK